MSDNWKARLFDLVTTCVAYDTGRIDHGEWEVNVLDALAHFRQVPTYADMEWAQRKAEGIKTKEQENQDDREIHKYAERRHP